ncbi:MAG: hypothetical protein HQ557_13900 [Bacteroidetes bacterium]|nr:hypothetical protein [Bacteroidota bacterium]
MSKFLQRKKYFHTLNVVLILLIFVISLPSCTQETPEILSVESRIRFVFNPADSVPQQYLAVHLEVENRDIAEAVQELRIFTETSSFTWEIESGKLQILDVDARTFIGTNAVSQPKGVDFPEGDYVIEIITGQGSRAESIITLPRTELFSGVINHPEKWFPSVTQNEDDSFVFSGGESYLIRRYDSSGNYIDAFYLDNSIIEPDSSTYALLKEYSHIEISVFNHTIGAELITGPVYL